MLFTEKQAPDLAQKLNVVERLEPFGVAQHNSLALGEVNELFHLLLKALGIVRYCLFGEHLTHIGPAGGVADVARCRPPMSATGAVPGHLEALHKAQGHEVAHVQREYGGAVKANVEGGFSVIDHVFYLIFIGYLRDEFLFRPILHNTH